MIPLAAFLALTQQCAPPVAPSTMAAVVRVESGFNPYAIGVVGGRLERQPANLDEAVATARALQSGGWDYSAGLAQVNRSNWVRLGLTPQAVFDPCLNLAAGAAILQGCFERARLRYPQVQDALRAGLSCYASGDFSTGFRTGYVQRVVADAARPELLVPPTTARVPPIRVIPSSRQGAPSDASRVPRPTPSTRNGERDRPTGVVDDLTQESAVVF
ncbi:lytic transglycosylase domain-containing protein [Paraburkholderia graminis]|uniref:lytic transglycosylase domain-containing protein n=1 Tax=Paraburkholderia graminis TaxID=60548 RepID=UPI003C960E99